MSVGKWNPFKLIHHATIARQKPAFSPDNLMSEAIQNQDDIGFEPDIHSSTDDYAERFSGAAGNWLLQRQQNVTLEYLGVLRAVKVLDVGGGHGQNIAVCESLNLSLTISGSSAACEHRVRKLSTSDRTRFIIGKLDALPMDEQNYPVVISYRIISHMQNWQMFIAELCRVSSDAVIIDFASKRSINWFSELAFLLKRGKEGDTRRYNVLSESGVNQVFNENGFKLAQRAPQFFFPMVIHRALNSPKISDLLELLPRLLGLNYLFGSPVISLYRRQLGV